jgi:DNA-binding beta-propeller fold protein YncE
MPQNFVYGLDVAAPTSTMVPPIGNPVLGLFGYGMLNGPFAAPTVALGGQTVQNVAVNTQANYILQELFLQIPNGTPGPADITVTSNNGSGTLKAAVTYIPFAAILPTNSNLVQLLYDTHRSLLYALQNNQILVLNPSTLQWQTPLLPGGSGGFGYASMALTPDGTQMIVLDTIASTLTVFDPDNPLQSVSIHITPSTGATFGNVVATSNGKAFIASLNGSTIEFDLATNTYTTTNIFSGLPSRLVASPDGHSVAGVNQNSGSGTLATWSSNSGKAAQSLANDIVWTDVAVSPKGDLFAAMAPLAMAG